MPRGRRKKLEEMKAEATNQPAVEAVAVKERKPRKASGAVAVEADWNSKDFQKFMYISSLASSLVQEYAKLKGISLADHAETAVKTAVAVANQVFENYPE